ncbi:hypothetical protein ALC56_15219, partial [Trachymyrmex septentrionalis]
VHRHLPQRVTLHNSTYGNAVARPYDRHLIKKTVRRTHSRLPKESAVRLLGARCNVRTMQRSRMHSAKTAFGGAVFFALYGNLRVSLRETIPCVGPINPTGTARRTDRNREKGEREKKGKKEREGGVEEPSTLGTRSALGDGTDGTDGETGPDGTVTTRRWLVMLVNRAARRARPGRRGVVNKPASGPAPRDSKLGSGRVAD